MNIHLNTFDLNTLLIFAAIFVVLMASGLRLIAVDSSRTVLHALGITLLILCATVGLSLPVTFGIRTTSVESQNASAMVKSIQQTYGLKIGQADATNLLGNAIDGGQLNNIAYGSIFTKINGSTVKVTLIRADGQFELINSGTQHELPRK